MFQIQKICKPVFTDLDNSRNGDQLLNDGYIRVNLDTGDLLRSSPADDARLGYGYSVAMLRPAYWKAFYLSLPPAESPVDLASSLGTM